jgi:signal transduction histidine kinase/HAMP domain-containing protein
MTAWQGRPGWAFLAISAAGTIGASLFLPSVRRPRGWAIAAVALLALTVAIAIRQTLQLHAVERDWDAWSANEREDRAGRVAASIGEVALVLQRAADRAARDTASARALSDGTLAPGRLLAPPLQGSVESALLLFRYGQLVDRAGQTRTPIAPSEPDGIRLVEGPFHTSLIARMSSPRGEVQAVAVALIASAPPADRFAKSLTQTLASRVDIARTVVESPDSVHVVPGSTVIVVPNGPERLARVRSYAYSEGETQLALQQQARARTGIPLFIAVLLVLVTTWRRPAGTPERIGTAIALLCAVAIAPLSALSNVSLLFTSTTYFAPMGGALTGNIAALLTTAALCLATLFTVLRVTVLRDAKAMRSRLLAVLIVVVIAVLGPFLLRDLARGITLPASGPSVKLWIAWQLGLALAGASVLLAGAAAGHAALGRLRGLAPAAAPALALGAAVLAPVLWRAPGAWPSWYPVLWVLAIGALALTRRGAALLVGAAVVAGAGATTLTWGETVRERMQLAEHDLERISAVDENARYMLERFAASLSEERQPVTQTTSMLRRYAASDLALAGYPARIARWLPTNAQSPVAEIGLAPVNDTIGAQSLIADQARQSGSIEMRTVTDGPTTLLVAAVPALDGSVITVAVPPRTRLLPADPFAALTGVAGDRGVEPPYRLTLQARAVAVETPRPLVWRRRGNSMHGDGTVTGVSSDPSAPLTSRDVHVEVELRGADVLLPRGALLIMIDVGVVLLLWGASAMADGALVRWLRVRRQRWSRSYRVRLSLALIGFFVAPAVIFAGWAWYRLQDDDAAARELLVREALRVAAAQAPRRALSESATSAGTPLFLYRDAQLAATSDTLLDALAPLGRLLPVSLNDGDFSADDIFTTRRIAVGEQRALVGYRRLQAMESNVILATPARGDEYALDARREDLGVLVLFATALGALAALWSSGVAARSLARPVGELREAALEIASGRTAPALGAAPAAEFAPVYRAFGRMAEDLSTSRAALEAAQRRTEAVLQHVASGVLALRHDGEILIANPRAESMLGFAAREPGASLHTLPAAFAPLAARSRAFLAGADEEDTFDVSANERQFRARITRLSGGAVLTIDDVTELASAQRVLAWGEMARQVAHEIKNPLTPIRLGVQHLRRAYRDGRGDFGAVLDTNVTRVLAEIDHLDEIARAFSRYGTAPTDRAPAEPVDVLHIVRDVLALERLGESGVTWSLEVAPDTVPRAFAGGDELREVLLNLLENARLAGSTTVTVAVSSDVDGVSLRVRDNGSGIAPDVLPQVFQPHFSTRTSGSGLGLAISRRMIEGWGGTIALTSAPDRGTVVHIRLRPVG